MEMAEKKWRRPGRAALVLCVSVVAMSPSLPSSLSFLNAHRLGARSRRRSAEIALSATYSASPGEEWTPEEEQRVMEEVLGRVPASSKETSSLAAETRLLRKQTEELVKELRLLRESLAERKGTSPSPAPAKKTSVAAQTAAPAPEAPPEPAVAPVTPSPAPTVAKESVAASPKAPSPPDPEPTQKTAPTDSTSVRVVSAGHGDGNIADFFLNYKKIDIRGEAGRRGINMVVLDPETQQVASRKTYDVWADPQTENTRLAGDISSLPDGRIVLVACRDSGMENLDAKAIAALWSAGATIPGGKEREGYALIGVKGGDALGEEQGGKVETSATVPFFVRHPPPLAPAPPPPRVTPQPKEFSPPTWATAAPAAPAAPAPKPSTFPTAPPTAEPTQKVRVPKLQVDPQGTVTYQDESVERDGKPEEQGQSWQEVVLMLDKLQEKIKAKRLAGLS